MGKIKSALYRFMYGRYGADTLGTCLFITYFVMIILQTFLAFFIKSSIFHLVWQTVAYAAGIFAICRMLSRKIDKRRAENQKFVNFLKLTKNKFKDRKTHVYRTCPSCKATLRLPRAKGEHTVVCPRCKNRFNVRG